MPGDYFTKVLMIRILTRIASKRDEGDGARFLVHLDDFFHHPCPRSDGIHGFSIYEIHHIQMEPAASFREPERATLVEIITEAGRKGVDKLGVLFDKEPTPAPALDVEFDNAMSGEATLDEFGKQPLGVRGPIESIGRMRQRKDVQRRAGGDLTIDRKDPRNALRTVIPWLVVRHRLLGLLHRVRHEVLAHGHRAFAPKCEMPSVRRPADGTDPSILAVDAIPGELGLGAGFFKVNQDHVATAEFHLVLTGRRFGTQT